MSSYAQYTRKLKNKGERDALQAKLKEEGIHSIFYYVKPIHKQGAFAEYNCKDSDFDVTNELCDIVISLHMHPFLTDNEIANVYKSLNLGFIISAP